jgi:hypothetical protein
MLDRQGAFAARLDSFSPVSWELIPDFGLYMDQVVTFVEKQCRNLFLEGERVFTPAMVNNYVKFGLVDRPNGKKYGREQLAQLMMICVLKQAASTDGMKALLKPPEGVTLQAHYESFCHTERAVFAALGEALPLPSPMTCAVQGAAYLFLCNALLFRQPEPSPDPRRADKAAQTPPASPATNDTATVSPVAAQSGEGKRQ